MKTKLFIIFFFCSGLLQAQSSFRPSIYFNNMNYYNPASGWDNEMKGEASVYLQHKWVTNDLFVKPTNIFANYIGNSKNKRHHFSTSYTFDMYSYYTRNILNGGYAYSLDFAEKGWLTFGARVSLAIDYIDNKKIAQPMDKNIGGVKTVPDFDLGIDYHLKGLSIGIGARNILATPVKADGYVLYKNQRLLNFNASYQFFIKDKVGFAPLVMLYLERNFGFDAGLNINVLKVVDASYIFRLNQLRHIGTLGVKIAKHYYIGIAADGAMLTKDINTDLNLRYRF